MSYFRCYSRLIAWTFIVTIFFGCAAQQSDRTSYPEESYQPQFQEDITHDIAVETIAFILGGKLGKFGIKYFGDPGINDYARQEDLTRLFEGADYSSRSYAWNEKNQLELEYAVFKSIPITDGRIALSPQLDISLSDLNETIKAGRKGTRNYCYFVNTGLISFYFKTSEPAYKLADMLFTLQKLEGKNIIGDKERLTDFESLAAGYRELSIKPAMSEEQRKLVVQANALNQRKDYMGAVTLYLKAINLDQVSYPGAYFNLALLYGQLERYQKAISCMKQYLMLVPDAGDARSAQDKIYEWEILMK